MTTQPPDPPIELEDVPEEEGVSVADAVDRLDKDPEEQVSLPEQQEQSTDKNRPEGT